jgi:hypothetical protein
MSHLAPEQLTGATENPNKISEADNASNWTQVESKNTQKRQRNNKRRPQTPPSIENTSFYEARTQKTTQNSQKKTKNAETFSLPYQTTRDSIHAVIDQTGNTDISPPAENRNKQNADMQQQKNSLPRPDQIILGSDTNAKLPNQATTHQTNSQIQKNFPQDF